MESEQARVPLPRWAAQQIRKQVADGAYAEGERLPSQRELAASMGISRAVLREAISVLESSGVLRTELGSGTFVAARPEAPVPATPTEAPRPPGSYAKLDVCRFRYVFEPACARLAAMRVTEDDLNRLGSNLLRFKEQVRTKDFTESAKTDEAFHHLIVEMAGVPLFIDMHLSMRAMLLDALTMPKAVQSRGWEPVVEHERILEALKRHDPDEAFYYMQSHIMRSSERLGLIAADEVL